MKKLAAGWRKLHNGVLHNLYLLLITIKMIKSRPYSQFTFLQRWRLWLALAEKDFHISDHMPPLYKISYIYIPPDKAAEAFSNITAVS